MDLQNKTKEELIKELEELQGELNSLKASCNYERIKAKEPVLKRESLLSNLLNFNAIMLLVEPNSGLILDANDAAVNFYGWEKDELLRMTLYQINTLSPEEIRLRMAEATKNKQNYFVCKHRLANASIHDVELYQSNVQLNDEVIFSIIIHDITDRIKTQENLRESEIEMNAILQSTADGILAIDSKGKVIKTNKRFSELWRVPQYLIDSGDDQALIRFVLDQLTNPDEFISKVKKLYQSTDEDLDYLYFKDGRTFERFSAPILMNDSSVGRVWSFRDITKQKKAEDELKKSEAPYLNLVNRMPDAVYKSTHAGKFIEINPAMVKMLGYDSKEELMAIDIKAQLYFEPTDRESIILQEQMEEMGVYRLKKKDGSAVWVEDHGWYNLGENGEIHTHEGIIRDITERKRVEDLLQLSEERYRAIIDNIGEGVGFVNAEEQFEFANSAAEKIFGVGPGELVGIKLDQLLSEDQYNLLQKETKKRAQGENSIYECEITRSDGEKRTILITAVAKIDQNGGFVGTYGVFSDITERKQAEESLQESEEKFKSIFNGSNDAIMLLSKNGFIDCNLKTLELFGFNGKEDLINLHPYELSPPYQPDGRNSRESADEKIRTTYQFGFNRFDWIHSRSNGEEFPVEVHLSLLNLRGERFIQAMVRDITERKKAEKLLIKSELKYRNLFENSQVSMIRSLLDGSRILEVNAKLTQVYGYSREEMLANPAIMRHSDPVRRKEMIALLNQNGIVTDFEVGLIAKDGSAKTALVSLVSYPEEGILEGSLIDITELKQAEEALRESEDWYKLITQNTLDIVFMLDKTGKLLFLNESVEKILGYKQEEPIGKSFTRFIPKSELPKYLLQLKNVFLKKEINNFTTKIYHKNGDLVDVEINGKLVKHGKDFLALGTIKDISEHKKAELIIKQKNEELLTINAEKDKFFSIIAHDLRTPLSGFLGLTQIMAEELPSLTMAEVQKIAVSLQNSATILFNLLENLLQWAQIQKGAITFNPEPVSIDSMLGEMIGIMEEPAKKKGIEIYLNVPEYLVTGADKNMLHTIIRNLISNALKFTKNGGKINVSARATSDHTIEIAIQDSGIGMSQSIVDNLFHFDVQTNRKGTEGEASTGLGLILCKEFIEKHGGRIWVESKEGKGSTFYFTIPHKA